MKEEEQIQQRIANIASVADLFPGIVIIHNLHTLGVEYMSEPGLRLLRTTLAELRAMGADYHRRYFNSEDVSEYLPRLQQLLARNNSSETVSFFQQVRASEAGPWLWYASAVRVLLHDAAGKPLLSLTFANRLDATTHITPGVKRLLEENDFSRQHRAMFRQLTPREKHILRLLVLGNSSRQIAQELSISTNTVLTHRRNIKAKLKPETSHDLSLYAYAFNLV